MELKLRLDPMHFDSVTAKVARINKRARRINVDPIDMKIGAQVTVSTPDIVKGTYLTRLYTDVTINWSPIRLAGWTLAGTVQSINGENIVFSIPGGDEIPACYRHTAPVCDHCRATRSRSKTIIVRHDDGRWAQLGTNCVQDYLGVPVQTMISAAAFWDELNAAILDPGPKGGYIGYHTVAIEHLLTVVAAHIRWYGWTSRTVARVRSADDHVPQERYATADLVWNYLFPLELGIPFRTDQKPEDQDRSLALRTLEWARSLPVDDSNANTYMYNLATIARMNEIDYRLIGLAASMITAYDKAHAPTETTPEKKFCMSEWIGTVGKRQDFSLTVTKVVTYEAPRYSRNGPENNTLLIMRDESGNCVKWFATGDIDVKEGDILILRGTVKAHGTYGEMKQTTLTRCKFAVYEPGTHAPQIG